eukprot:TRINITY_DN9806_c0_g1_i1.p1 TRINITY_DN9806_c0_g1~~TRINITY_DN9806_c0_g1_i1.p1  ORF type:complete len:148 (-),score=22.30 TRINITY_DN9806_c0_g1_i1:193-636(-)
MTSMKIGQAPEQSPYRHRTKELYDRNHWAARSAPERAFAVQTMLLGTGTHPVRRAAEATPHFQEGRRFPDDRWFRSSATSAFKYGVYPGQGLKGLYMRDPHTGVWFKDTNLRLWNEEMKVPSPSSQSKSSGQMIPMNHLSCTIKKMP